MNDELNSNDLNILIKNFNLSEKQKDIVEAIEDNILVIACPGSGKTHTLIAKYINMLLKYNLKPEETIMITFTKKAGIEMLNRLNKIIPNKTPYYVGTIHGLSYKILKEYNNLKNIVMDEQDVKCSLDNIINNQKLENSEIIKSNIQSIIDQSSITHPFNMKSVLKKYNLDNYSKEFNLIYKLYNQKKKQENLIDFNDLMIMLSNFLLDKKSDQLKNKMKYIFFDEYQDINSIQNNILLKLSEYSKVMVVGDDAQSIYSFRGSSVKYILNYNLGKSHKMYLLEENYRSTSSIVNFCQDIISHNLNQFNKNIKSMKNNLHDKPHINSFKTIKEQYEWITNDIIKKVNDGVKLSDIAILSRKNSQLNDIELYLISRKISVSKHIGLALLNKSHVKDFIAFIIILINPKSQLHWRRIICLHSGYDNAKANKILEDSSLGKDLPELHNLIIQIKKINKDIEKTKLIINYLEQFWPNTNDKKDIYNLLDYLKDLSLEEFINDLFLNQDIDTTKQDTLYLSTIHGAKGLEWDHVYIIDMNSRDFPFIRPKYYIDELEEIDEERRLFYVASSRAKEKLTITFHNNVSSLLREINPLLYINQSYTESNINVNKIKPTLDISLDIKNYLNLIGYYNISKVLIEIVNNKSSINKHYDIPKNYNVSIISKIINCLILKIIQKNYQVKIKNNQDKIDFNISWENMINSIFSLPSFKYINISDYYELLNNNMIYNYYTQIEKGICKIINKIKPNDIYLNYITTYGSVSGIIDILCDNIMFELGTNLNCNNVCEKLLHAYLLKKNNYNITNIIFYNPSSGEINNLDITKINIIYLKKLIY